MKKLVYAVVLTAVSCSQALAGASAIINADNVQPVPDVKLATDLQKEFKGVSSWTPLTAYEDLSRLDSTPSPVADTMKPRQLTPIEILGKIKEAELIAVENCKKATGRSCVAYTGEKMSGANEWNGKAVATAFVLPWTLDEFQKTYSAKGSVSFATQTFGNVVDSWADLETDKRLTNIARLGAMKIAEVKAVSDCYKAGNKVCIPGKARQISDDGFTYVVSVTALGMWSFPPAGK